MSEGSAKPAVRMIMREGRPVIMVGEEPLSQAIYSDPVLRPGYDDEAAVAAWVERHRQFRDSGAHLFSLIVARGAGGAPEATRFWTGDGVYPECSPEEELFCVDRQAAALLEMDPQARFIVRWADWWPDAWLEANPDHVHECYSGERREFAARRPSLASEKAREALCRYMQRIVSYCEAQEWAERVFAYSFFAYGEGIPTVTLSGFMFDVSPVMQEAFRRWVREKYEDEAALREAWGDPEASFETVRVPTDPEWRADLGQCEWCEGGKEGEHEEFQSPLPPVWHWTEGDQLRRYRDYWELQRVLLLRWYRGLAQAVQEVLARPVLFGIDTGKQPMLGWQHNMSFGGHGPGADYLDLFAASGNVDLGELLDEPGLTFWWTPADYTDRSVGYGWESEGASDSLRLRGKAICVENDQRTYVESQAFQQGAFRDLAETKAGMLRNAAWCLTRGQLDYICNVGGGFYTDPAMHEQVFRPLVRMLDAAPRLPHVETEHALAMIVDDSAPWQENGTSGFQNLAVLWQRVLGLSHCGIPYRVYLWSDLQRENMPDYRCYLFPNLFKVDEERLSVLREKIFREGRMAIFGPATGITDGERLSAKGASAVLGVEMELVQKHAPRRVMLRGGHRVVRSLPASLVYGDSYHYGPILVPAAGAVEEAGAEELGLLTAMWEVNRAGLVVRDAGTHQVAWSGAMPLPGGLLRELAREGGCHVWCEEEDVLLASESVVALHSVKAGPRTVKLPGARTVWDLLSGEKLGEGLSEVSWEVEPPETRVFYLGEGSPF